MSLTLEQSTALCRLLADESRLRLLLLLGAHELTAAELTQITRLAQSRVSTHLSRLQRAGLVSQRRAGGASVYTAADSGAAKSAGPLWDLLRGQLDDAQARADRERASEVIRQRRSGGTWAESVAGRMEESYSPGRTWEATARALLGLLELGDVLDIACGDGVLAELVAPRARSVTGVDISATVIDAAAQRLQSFRNVKLLAADMHSIPLPDRSFDQVFVLNALAYTRKPQAVLAEAARLLRPSGSLLISALNAHTHKDTVAAYDHVNLGIAPAALSKLLEQAGFRDVECAVTSREDRPPYFEVITARARR